MPHVAWRLSECHAWHHISGGDLIWIMPRVVQKMRNMCPNPNQHVRRQGRRGAAFMPRVAHAPPGGGACGVGPRVAREPGGGRSGRRACHTWHINRAGGRAGGVGPRLVREPGRGATRGTRKRDLMPRAAWKLSKCHTWHQILFFRAMRGTPGREATRGTRKRDLMPRVA